MKDEITIEFFGYIGVTKTLKFSGGELHVKLGIPFSRHPEKIVVRARLQDSDAFMRLALVTEMLRRKYLETRLELIIPYFPYARQDRVTSESCDFGLKVMAKLINGLGYDSVVVYDPHSDVTPALIENIRVVHQHEIVENFTKLRSYVSPFWIVVSPDAGAAKKAEKVCSMLGASVDLVVGRKHRDVGTGEITGTSIDAGAVDLKDRYCLIVDDICDGGRTFTELATVLKREGVEKVYLYVTHGIFSKGLDVFKGLIDGVFTTDSFISEFTDHPERAPFVFHVMTTANRGL